jgi:hypothetical protein
MNSRICVLLLVLTLFALPAHAEEGSPLLSVDDLLSLEESYEVFLEQLGDLAVERGLLSEDERAAWHDAQMGDFYQNGGYGSILVNYMPGALDYTREEETLLTLSAKLDGGTLELMTMRRYTPRDSTLSGLMLTPSMTDDAQMPMDAHYSFGSTSGVFMKWDALLGTYVSVGATAESDGETVVWSAQTPAENAKDPVLTITVTNGREPLGEAALTLTVDGEGYRVDDYALN